MFIARDVSFVENEFPFNSIPSSPQHVMFPPQHTNYCESDPSSTLQPLIHVTETNAEDQMSESVPDSNIGREPVSRLSNIPQVPTRPHRKRTLPVKYQDYTCLSSHIASTSVCKPYDFNHTLQYDQFNTQHTHFLANISKIVERHTYKQVVTSADWCATMTTELAALEANAI